MPQLIYVTRQEWGATQATENYIAARPKASAAEKTTIQVHHTATTDTDASKNRWTYAAAERYMRSLQTARPELGPLPYSLNVAVSEDAQTVWIFEGRGPLPVGAHTAGHNWDGVGCGIFGNFDLRDDQAALAAVHAIEAEVAKLRREGLVNLGQVKNPRGWNAWGHRDSSPKSCPGNTLYPLLSQFSLDTPGGDDMEFIITVLKGQNMAYYRALKAKTGVPGGNPDYWGSDYTGQKPSHAEWQAAADDLLGASLQAGVFAEAGSAVDQTARNAAAAAQTAANKANTDLAQIKSVIG